LAEDFNGDWEYWVMVALPKVLLDATYELLHLRAFTCLEGQVIVSVQGVDMAQVLLDCGRSDGSEAEVQYPFHDCEPGSRQGHTIRVGQMGVEPDEIKELALVSAVGLVGGGGKAMPEQECTPSREHRVCLIPASWGSIEDGRGLREGVSMKRSLYW